MRNNTTLGSRWELCGSIFWTLDTSFTSWITFTLPLSSTKHHCLVLGYVTVHQCFCASVSDTILNACLLLTWSTALVRPFQSLRAQGVGAWERILPCLVRCARNVTLPTALHLIPPWCLPRWRLAPFCKRPCARQHKPLQCGPSFAELLLRSFRKVTSWLCFVG